jgi:hypothetical protein
MDMVPSCAVMNDEGEVQRGYSPNMIQPPPSEGWMIVLTVKHPPSTLILNARAFCDQTLHERTKSRLARRDDHAVL